MSTQLFLILPGNATPEAAEPSLRAVLAAAEIAALLLPQGSRSPADYAAFVRTLAPLAQQAGAAVLVDGPVALARMLGVDGVHVDSPAGAKAAIAAAKPDLIVGAGGIATRHDAMAMGELGVDYIMFGPLSGAIAPEMRDLAAWWAEIMEIPSVLCDPAATAATADAEGCEFLGLSDSIWAADDPAADIVGIAAALEDGA
jgi:thiamine-phosphate pyrophosphorylase